MTPEDEALLQLLRNLCDAGYDFVTPTPATHARVVGRAKRMACDLRDVFGWSMTFSPDILPAAILDNVRRAGMLETGEGGLLRSRVRVSTLGGDLYLHSAYPTDSEDAVFFGPDSYRFARLIRDELERRPLPAGARVVDIGTGSGVGAITAARWSRAAQIAVTDVNPQALRFAAINAQAAGLSIDMVQGSGPASIDRVDLALVNPPYIIDEKRRAYRDGGDMHGAGVALRIAAQAVERLAPDGRFILYTGSPIVAGEDRLRTMLLDLAARAGCEIAYSELDPDVFGEELENDSYASVERISLIAAVISRTG